MLALAAAGFLLLRATASPAARVNVYLNGELYATAALDEPQEITVTQPDGATNVIVIDAFGVRMGSSSCANQLCVQQGALQSGKTDALPLGNWIVCLPNGVTVQLEEGDG